MTGVQTCALPICFPVTIGCIVFDGTNDYVFTGSIGTLSSTTLISFIKRNGNQPDYAGILCNRNQSNITTFFGTLLLSNQLISYWGNVQKSTVATVPDSVWCMTAFSVTPTSSTLYLYSPNGISSATSVSSHGSTLTTNIWIGWEGSTSFSRYFKGNIATSMIYNRALSQAEITQNYNALKSRFGLT